jgi:Ca2+-transporting ATPase
MSQLANATVTDTAVEEARAWHRLPVEAVFAELGTSEDGLDEATVERRQAEYGPNELTESATTSKLTLIWQQISSVMVLILIGAAVLSLLLGKYLEAGAIGAIVVLFAALGFIQEYRAEQAIAALKRMAVPSARVTRGGRMVSVPVGELVPGDVVHLDAGTVVPADVRMIEVASLRIEEAALTGESEPIDKQVEEIDEDDLALGDRLCMGYSGTQVAAGRGVAVVVGTGMRTELGKIAALLQGVKADETPLQRRLDRVGKQLALIGIAVAVAVVIMGAISGEDAADLVLTAISVAVAVIPEGLPAVVTFTLAIGAQRMLRRQALIRKLPAVETLGSVTVICSDKTGTLTQNKMTVTVLDVADHEVRFDGDGTVGVDGAPSAVPAALVAGLLCNDGAVDVDEQGNIGWIGDPTETALLQAAQVAGFDVAAFRERMPRIDERPFDSTRKRMSTVHGAIGGAVRELSALPQDVPLAFVKGAVDGLLQHATAVWSHDAAVPFDDGWRERILAANEKLASNGMRVLGIAFRTMDADDADPESDLTLLGLVGIIDPPRPEVRDAVAVCRSAGIRPVMITGDHPLTALAIATDLGIADTDRVLVGAELDHLSDEEFSAAARDVSVFARVSPEHKLRIVGALQEQHQVVAMTGDGVNDAPALKRADIGVAMGITGTDVSKEAADMVLRDDNFATIVAAVEEGRVIYDNLRRFVSYAVAGNLGKIIVMLGWPIPFLVAGSDGATAIAFLPLQLLWLNLMTDGLLGLSMGVEPAEKRVMQRPPHSPSDGLWANGLGQRTAWVGMVIGIVTLGLGFAYYASDGDGPWQTIMFTTLALMQIGQAFATRSSIESLRTIGWNTNRVMLGIAALVFALQLLLVLTPLRGLLDLQSLSGADIAVCIVAGIGLLVLVELVKAIQRSRERAKVPADA